MGRGHDPAVLGKGHRGAIHDIIGVENGLAGDNRQAVLNDVSGKLFFDGQEIHNLITFARLFCGFGLALNYSGRGQAQHRFQESSAGFRNRRAYGIIGEFR
jgi:hypothetical protein